MAATFGLFVSENWIKDNTAINGNMDVADIAPFLKAAQDVYIQDVLGSKLYHHLQAAIIANTLTQDEKDLLNLIRPCLSYYAVFDGIPFIAIKLKNKGVMKQAGDNLTNATIEELRMLRQECKNKAEYYLKRVQDYLYLNGRIFPDYIHPDVLMWPNRTSSFTCPLAFDEFDASYIDISFFRKYLL